MDIAPLALVVLLGYGLLIAISLTTWTAITYFREDDGAEGRLEEVERRRAKEEKPRARRAVSNDEVRGARSRRARGSSDPFRGDTRPADLAAAPEISGSGRSGAVTWKPETGGVAKRSGAHDDGNEEDAFERFLNSRSDDFDIR